MRIFLHFLHFFRVLGHFWDSPRTEEKILGWGGVSPPAPLASHTPSPFPKVHKTLFFCSQYAQKSIFPRFARDYSFYLYILCIFQLKRWQAVSPPAPLASHPPPFPWFRKTEVIKWCFSLLWIVFTVITIFTVAYSVYSPELLPVLDKYFRKQCELCPSTGGTL